MNVDVSDQGRRAAASSATAPNTVYQTDVFAKYGDQADAEIARIIAAKTPARTVGTREDVEGQRAAGDEARLAKLM